MFAWLTHFIEKHPSLHRISLSLWRLFPPRLAGFLKGQLARNWLVGAVAVLIDDYYVTLWRNWIARWTSNPTVAGSNPVSVVLLYYSVSVAQLDSASPS